MDERRTASRRAVLAGGAGAAAAWSATGLVARAQGATPAASPAAGQSLDASGSYVTISHYRIKDGADPAALVAAVRDRLLPILNVIPGFWEYRLVLSDDGIVTSIRVFQTAEGASEGSATARAWAEANLADLSELPAFQVYEGRLEVDADGY